MSSSSRGVGEPGGSRYSGYDSGELNVPSDDRRSGRSNGHRRNTSSTSQYGSSLRPDDLPQMRASNTASSATPQRTRTSLRPPPVQSAGGSSSSAMPNTRMMRDIQRYAGHASTGRMSETDDRIAGEIEAFCLAGEPPEHPVAQAIVQHARQFRPPSNSGTVAGRRAVVEAALDDLSGAEMEAPVARSSQSSRAVALPPSLPPNAHHLVAGAIGNHLFDAGPIDRETQRLIDEMMALETQGAMPPRGSPMRPIAEMLDGALRDGGTNVQRQNVMFLALSNALGVRPEDVLGGTDGATGLPENARFVVREAGTMASWMEEVALHNADETTRTAAAQINRYIETGEIPPYGMDEQTATIIEVASRETSPAGTPRGTPRGSPRRSSPPSLGSVGQRRTAPDTLAPQTAQTTDEAQMERRNAVVRVMLRVMNNEAEGALGRVTFSGINSLTRNVFTVLAPTMLRQYLDQGVASGTMHWSEHHQLGLSLAAALVPPMLLGIGAYVDRDKATTASNLSRASLALVSFGAIATGLATGNMASVGPALVGFLAYAAMRDLGQSFIKLDNPDANPQMRVGTTLKAAAAYVLNQTIASALMTYLASPSGAGAAGLPLAALAGFLRGVINMAAESGDDMTYNALASREQDRSLGLTLSGEIPSPRQLLTTYTTTSPARATLSTVDTMFSAVLGSALASTHLGSTAQINYGNFFGAAVLGMLYTSFLHIHQAPPEDNVSSARDSESGTAPQVRVSGGRDEESYRMSRLSLGDDGSRRSHHSTPSRQGFTGNVGLGPRSNRPSREPSVIGLPPTPRDDRSTRSRTSSMAALPPTPYDSRDASLYEQSPFDPTTTPPNSRTSFESTSTPRNSLASFDSTSTPPNSRASIRSTSTPGNSRASIRSTSTPNQSRASSLYGPATTPPNSRTSFDSTRAPYNSRASSMREIYESDEEDDNYRR